MMNRLFTALVALLALAATGAAGNALELSPDDLERLGRAESRYKVSADMEPRIQALVAPFVLDGELPGGYVLDGISIERYFIRYDARKGDDVVSLYVLPPTVSVDAQAITPNFKLVAEGPESGAETAAALLAAVTTNDQGEFWPEPPPAAEEPGRQIAPAVRKVHFTELVGDLLVVLLIVALFLGIPSLRKAFSGRPLAWWWGMLGIFVYAFVVRLVIHGAATEGLPDAAWTPSGGVVHSSVAWYLTTIGRFMPMSMTTVAVINLVFGVLTVLAIYLLVSLLVDGVWPPVVAALFAASSPMHAALSGTITVMVPFLFFVTAAALCVAVYARTMEARAHLLAVAWLGFAVFARPEGIVLVLPVLALPFLLTPRDSWTRIHFWGPILLGLGVVLARALTLPSAPDFSDAFLVAAIDWGTFHSNVGIWLFGFSRVSFGAMLFWAMGVATRPWKRDLGLTLCMAGWLLLGIAVYFHVDMTATFQGGRVALYFLVPFAWLAALGTRFLTSLKHTQRWWILTLLLLWLLFSPLIHRDAIAHDYQAVFQANFLLEA
jgi:hypothetical protein